VSTHQDILNHLAKNAFSSAEDLAQVLGKTRANIQHHLKQMEMSGAITPVYPQAHSSERGRPRRFFSLSPKERPNNLVMLADALLEHLGLSVATSKAKTEVLADIGQRIVALQSDSSSTTASLNRLVRELSVRGYQARWEAHASGPELVFRNCPYAALLPGHPELCQIDTLILERHMGQPMVQKARIQLPEISACRFVKETTSK
jgi:predicted ArsR family transcriptional regulator